MKLHLLHKRQSRRVAVLHATSRMLHTLAGMQKRIRWEEGKLTEPATEFSAVPDYCAVVLQLETWHALSSVDFDEFPR